jgi:hypothetical protein
MKDKQKYLIIPYHQNYTLNKQLLFQVAQLLGYKVIIGKPTDTCRGYRANIISWIDDFPDFPEDVISPLDKPSKS